MNIYNILYLQLSKKSDRFHSNWLLHIFQPETTVSAFAKIHPLCVVSKIHQTDKPLSLLPHTLRDQYTSGQIQGNFQTAGELKFNMVHLKIRPWKRRFRTWKQSFSGSMLNLGGVLLLAKLAIPSFLVGKRCAPHNVSTEELPSTDSRSHLNPNVWEKVKVGKKGVIPGNNGAMIKTRIRGSLCHGLL